MIWFRTPTGLENSVVTHLCDSYTVQPTVISPRNVLLNYAEINFDRVVLSLCDDIYVNCLIHETNHKISIEEINKCIDEFIRHNIEKLNSSNPVRVTCSLLGSRSFNRFKIEKRCITSILAFNSFKILSNEEGDKFEYGEQRIRVHIQNEFIIIGFSIEATPLHRRSYRTKKYNGQLHPTIAANMAYHMLKNLSLPSDMMVVDPYCGSGTILIESYQYGFEKILGYDISNSAIQLAEQSIKLSNAQINVFVGEFNANSINEKFCIISNPPWGYKHKSSSVYDRIKAWKLNENCCFQILLVSDSNLEMIDTEYTILFDTRVKGKPVKCIFVR